MREIVLYEKNGDNAIYRNHKGDYYRILGLKYKMINDKKELCVIFEPYTYKIKDYFFIKTLDDFLDIRVVNGEEQYKFIHISEIKNKEEQINFKTDLYQIIQLKRQKNNFNR